MDRKAHWEQVWTTKASTEVSWYQAEPLLSRALLREIGMAPSTSVLDVGGGDSRLVDALLADEIGRITVLDLSGAALTRARTRLGARADTVTWIEADVTTVVLPPQSVDIWHDRAVFHFLTDVAQRHAYVERVLQSVKPGGHVIVATFAEDGPDHCSGLPVMRYGADALHAEFGAPFELLEHSRETHHTPGGAVQQFVYCYCRRSAS